MVTKSPSISRAVSASIRDAQILPRDGATVALARRYAALIDDAAQVADELDTIKSSDDDVLTKLHRLKARVDAIEVISDLGPKLLASLASLRMTPAARSASKGGKQDVGSVHSAEDVLARLREKRAAGR